MTSAERRAQDYFRWYLQYSVPALAHNPSWTEDLRMDWIQLGGTDALAGFHAIFAGIEKGCPVARRLMVFLVKHRVMYS